MPLIKPEIIEEESHIRIRIKISIMKEMEAYCQWAGISNYNDFVGKCICYVFTKDKDWRTHNN